MKKRRFHINGEYYDIPDTEVDLFISDNPHAEEVRNYNIKGTQYNIPIKEVDAFESDMGFDDQIQKDAFQKKSGGESGLQPSTPTTLQSQLPEKPKDEFEGKNPIDLVNEADKLSKQKISAFDPLSTTGGNIETEDKEAIGKSKKIKDYLGKKDIDVKEVQRVFGDVPDVAYEMTMEDGSKPQSKEQLFQEYQVNPIDAENKVNNIKTQFALKNAGNDAAGNYFMTLQGTPVNTLNEYQSKIKNQQQIIGENLTGEERDKALQRLQQTSAPNINAVTVSNEYKNSPLNNLVTLDEYAGLETWKLFEPDRYKSAINILKADNPETSITPELEDAPMNRGMAMLAAKKPQIERQIGKETIHRQLSEIGRNNAGTKLTADQYNLNEAFKNTNDPIEQEQISGQYFANQQKINGLKTDAQVDDARFPLTAQLKFDNIAKEITGNAGMGQVMTGAQHYAKGFESSLNTVVDILVGLFGSEKMNTNLQMGTIGRVQQEQSDMYLPANLTGAEFGLKASTVLKEKANQILKGRDISDLSIEETKQLTDLVGRNLDEITTVANDKGKNFFSKATGYKIAGFTGDIASFIAQTLTLKGVGMGAKAAELNTLFNTTYSPSFDQAIAEGKSPAIAHQIGLLHGGVILLAGTVSSKYDLVKSILGESKSVLSKEILGMGEKAWNKIVGKSEPLIKKVGNAAKALVSDNAKMIATYGVGTTILNRVGESLVFNEHHSAEEIANESLEAAKEMAIGSLGLVGAGFIMHVTKNPVTLRDKANMWEVGVNKEISKAKIDEAVLNNSITESEGNLRKKTIDNISTLIQKVPVKNDRGKYLTDEQRVSYLYNLVVKDKAKEAVSDLPPKQSEEAEHEGLVAEHKNQILLSQPTEKQLETRKGQLEKALIPKKDADGKNIEIPEAELKQTKAELESVNEAIKNKISENEKYAPKPTEETSIIDEGEKVEPELVTNKEVPIVENKNVDLSKPVYHGTFGDFEQFDEGLLGSNTGANSAKEGFFFATNKKVAEGYGGSIESQRRDMEKRHDEAVKQIEDLTGDSIHEAGGKLVQQSLHGRDSGYSPEVFKKVDRALKRISDYEDFLNTISDEYWTPSNKLSKKAKLKEVYLDMKKPFVFDAKEESIRKIGITDIIKKAKETGYDGVVIRNTYDSLNPATNELTDVHIVFKKDQIKSEPKPKSEVPIVSDNKEIERQKELNKEKPFSGKRGQADYVNIAGEDIYNGRYIDLKDVNISQDDSQPQLRSGKYKVKMISINVDGKTGILTLSDGNEIITPTFKDLINSKFKSESKPITNKEVQPSIENKSDSDLEKRWNELNDSNLEMGGKEHKEFDAIEKELQKRERESVFNVPLKDAGKALDKLGKRHENYKTEGEPFIDKNDVNKSKEVVEKYLNPKDISDAEIKKDFKEAVMGNPDTWYADGLKLRESMKEAANRGIDSKELIGEVEKEFIKDGYTAKEAQETVARKLKPIFEGSTKVETDKSKLLQPSIEDKNISDAEVETMMKPLRGKNKSKMVEVNEIDPKTNEIVTKKVKAKDAHLETVKQIKLTDLIIDCLTKH